MIVWGPKEVRKKNLIFHKNNDYRRVQKFSSFRYLTNHHHDPIGGGTGLKPLQPATVKCNLMSSIIIFIFCFSAERVFSLVILWVNFADNISVCFMGFFDIDIPFPPPDVRVVLMFSSNSQQTVNKRISRNVKLRVYLASCTTPRRKNQNKTNISVEIVDKPYKNSWMSF